MAGQTSREAILLLASEIDRYRALNDYAALQRLARDNFFAAAKYVLAAAGEALPARLEIVCESDVPPSSGLGSGGSLFVALAAALAHLIRDADIHGDGCPRRPCAAISWRIAAPRRDSIRRPPIMEERFAIRSSEEANQSPTGTGCGS